MPLALRLFLVCALPGLSADFMRDAHPILAQHCFACHGGDKRSGGLSLRDYTETLKGGRDGAVIVPGKPEDSLLIRRVTAKASPMPPAGPRLNEQEIATLRSWITDGARETAQGAPASTPWTGPLALSKPPVPEVDAGRSGHPVDRLLAAYSREQHVTLAAAVTDRVFARRAYLDIWGLLPMPEQLAAFVNSKDLQKRAKLVGTLLANKRNYAEHWISFWNDLLRNDEGVNYAGTRKSITPWLYSALNDNLPYDRFVEKLLNPVDPGDPDGFLLGVNWRGDINASQTPLMQAAQNSAQVFLGINLKCNSCHDSFISKWKLKDAYGLAAYFAEDPQLELVRCDNRTGEFTGAKFLFPELDSASSLATLPQRKAAAARMFLDPRNGRTPRTLVNRVWARLMGHGFVPDVDDMDARPWDPELLDWLAADFVENGFDIKRLLATIMTSQAYQLPSVVRGQKEIKDYVFRGPEVRRMSAEEFADSLSAITGQWPVYARPESTRGIYSREWRIGSSAMTRALGRPIRDQVFTERNQDATTLQALELVNGEVLTHRLALGAKRMLGQLPPAPMNLFDTGRLRDKSVSSIDIDITGVKEMHLLAIDQGSYSPERVVPAWADAVLIGPKGSTPLPMLKPLSGRTSTSTATFNGVPHPDALVTTLQSDLVYDLQGAGYTRFQAQVSLDDSCRQNDITPEARFFVFPAKPDPERMLQVDPETPVPVIQTPPDAAGLVTHIFEYMLGRRPSHTEQRIAVAEIASGRTLKPAALADLLWSIAMQPEFQLIY